MLADGILLEGVPFMMPAAVAGFGVALASGLFSVASLDLAPLLVGASMIRNDDVSGEEALSVGGSKTTCVCCGDYCVHDVSSVEVKGAAMFELPVVLYCIWKRQRPQVWVVQQVRATATGCFVAGPRVCRDKLTDGEFGFRRLKWIRDRGGSDSNGIKGDSFCCCWLRKGRSR